MRFGSVCSGIEAASVAWEPLGWEAAWFSEIEPFPCAVLAHHYPSVPNLGDMTKLPNKILEGEVEAPDVFCGGTPCQAFSVAGKRQSLDDARGNLSLVFCEIANAIDDVRGVAGQQPTIVFWENVPGVLSTKDNAFGCFLGELAGEDCAIEPPRGKWTNAGCVYGPKRTVAWRVLDAQYFGVAQRRRRVFVVASARNDFDPAAVLFEFDGLRRDSAPSREAGKVAPTIPSRSTAGGGLGTDFDCDGGVITAKLDVDICGTLTAGFGKVGAPEVDAYTCIPAYPINTMIALRHEALGERTGFGIGEPGDPAFTITKGHSHAVAQPIAFSCKDNGRDATVELTPTLRSMAHSGSHQNGGGQLAVCMRESGQGYWMEDDKAGTLRAEGENRPSRPSHVIGMLVCVHGTQDPCVSTETAFALGRNSGQENALAVALRGREGGATAELGGEVQNCLRASSGGGDKPHVLTQMAVRRLTPVECERLQGFPDNYTQIPWRKKPASECPDGPRYKALGNSWAVPVVRWIGQRIQLATEIAA